MGSFQTIPQRMSGEKYHILRGSLTFSTASIELELAPGERYEGSFTIYGPTGVRIDGLVGSSVPAMRCYTDRFAGSADEISYGFDAAGYEAGERVEGFFRIVSNQGEYRLPFAVSVCAPVLTSRSGRIDSLRRFAALARENREEAAALFASREFEALLGDDEEAKLLRRGLLGGDALLGLEEFLVATGHKAPVQILTDRLQLRSYPSEREVYRGEIAPLEIPLEINGWGDFALHVETDGDFLVPAKDTVVPEDFEGGRYALEIGILPEALHAGRNLGRVRIRGIRTQMEIPVEVVGEGARDRRDYTEDLEYDRIILNMMQYYEQIRAKRISGRDYLAQMRLLIDRLRILRPRALAPVLYQIHLDISAGQTKEANWQLAELEREMPVIRDPQLASYREYLTALAQESDTAGALRAAAAVEDHLRRDPGNWRIAWLLIYLSPEYRKRPSLTWDMLREQFERGSRSPVLYIEAWQLMSVQPAILTELDEYALQILNYARKQELTSENVLSQVCYLTGRVKGFSRILYRYLTDAYAKGMLQGEVLAAICSLLLRARRTDAESFVWYERGVEAQLSLTQLFEYYLLSMPEDFDGEIPELVLMYFGYQSSIPVNQRAVLYRYVMENAARYPQIYAQYEPRILDFVRQQLEARRLSRPLCRLFSACLSEELLTKELAGPASRAVYATHVHTRDPRAAAIIVLDPRMTGERRVPFEDGSAIVPIYSEDELILIENTDRERCAGGIAVITEPLMDQKHFLPMVGRMDTGNTAFDLMVTQLPGAIYDLTENTLPRFERLVRSERTAEKTRSQLILRLLDYYDRQGDKTSLMRLAESIPVRDLRRPERNRLARLLLKEAESEKALAILGRGGILGMAGEDLLAAAEAAVGESPEPAEDPEAVYLSFEAFQAGSMSQKTLTYLSSFFEGLSVEMEQIRAALRRHGMDDAQLVERMVDQMLYSGVVLPQEESVLLAAEAGGAGREKLSALMAQLAHYAFTEDMNFSGALYDRIALYDRDGEMPYDICRIAWLRRMAERAGELSEDELLTARSFLQVLLAQQIVFPFYRHYAGLLPELQAYADETMIQYRGRRGANVLIHYCVDRQGRGADDYQVRPMREMVEGCYVAGFVLFFGEQVRYFITDDFEQTNVVESGSFGQDTRIQEAGEDRFAVINRISMHTAMRSYEEAVKLLGVYNHRALLVEKLFGEDEEDDI